jgi:hypothetical protein
MANVNAPFGLRPVRTLAGSPFNEQAERVFIPSTDTSAYYFGDAVTSAGSSDANGIAAITKYSGAGTLRGVIVGFDPDPANQTSTSMTVPATKTRGYYAMIVQDPNTVFQIQGDATAFAATNIGGNANLTIAAPSSIGVQSGTVLSGGSVAATSTLAVRILGLSNTQNNSFGAYAVFDVKINNSEFSAGVAGV